MQAVESCEERRKGSHNSGSDWRTTAGANAHQRAARAGGLCNQRLVVRRSARMREAHQPYMSRHRGSKPTTKKHGDRCNHSSLSQLVSLGNIWRLQTRKWHVQGLQSNWNLLAAFALLLLLLLPLPFGLVPSGRPLPGRHHYFVKTLLGPLALLLPPVHQPLVQGPVGVRLHLGRALGVAPCTQGKQVLWK